MTDGGQVPDDTPADDGRSGAQVDDAVDTAAGDAPHDGTLRPPGRPTRTPPRSSRSAATRT